MKSVSQDIRCTFELLPHEWKSRAVFPKYFCPRSPFGFEKKHGSSHPCSCKYIVSGW